MGFPTVIFFFLLHFWSATLVLLVPPRDATRVREGRKEEGRKSRRVERGVDISSSARSPGYSIAGRAEVDITYFVCVRVCVHRFFSPPPLFRCRCAEIVNEECGSFCCWVGLGEKVCAQRRKRVIGSRFLPMLCFLFVIIAYHRHIHSQPCHARVISWLTVRSRRHRSHWPPHARASNDSEWVHNH